MLPRRYNLPFFLGQTGFCHGSMQAFMFEGQFNPKGPIHEGSNRHTALLVYSQGFETPEQTLGCGI